MIKQITLATLLFTSTVQGAVDVIFGGYSKHFTKAEFGEYNETHDSFGVEYRSMDYSFGYMSFTDSHNYKSSQISIGQHYTDGLFEYHVRLNLAERSLIEPVTDKQCGQIFGITSCEETTTYNVKPATVIYPSFSISKEIYKGFGASLSAVVNPVEFDESVLFFNFTYRIGN